MQVFRTAKAILGESLVWDADAGAMLWCDITAGLIHRSPTDGATDGSDDTTIALPPPVASFGLSDDGGLVVSLGDRVVLTDARGEVTRTLAMIEHGHPEMRLNEGKVDLAGRWITGSMDLRDGDPDGAFYAVTPSGAVTLIGGVAIGNGLEFADGRIWFTDTGAATIYVADYDGAISNVAAWHSGEPHDGLVMAADGTFWGALYGEGKVVHYAADATELETVELPAPNVTSVALDGAGRLYVASARENLTEEQLEAHPLSGSIFVFDTDSAARPQRRFSAG